MTLILTAGRPEFIVQVSDRRFIDLDTGTVVTGEGNKATVIRTLDVDFAVSFTGLATLEGELTSDWIVNRISDAKAAQGGFDACVLAIREAADRAFSRQELYPHVFVFAGFEKGAKKPLVVSVSNYDSDDFKPPTKPHFSISRVGKPYVFRSHGCVAALPRDAVSKMRGYARRVLSYPGLTDLAVEQIRRASAHPKLGRYIGRECMSVMVASSGDVQTVYHPTHGNAVSFAPNLIEVTEGENGPLVLVMIGFSQGGSGIMPASLGSKGVSVLDRRVTRAIVLDFQLNLR